jgi:XTP/dITP diphosphohydrolase
VTTKTLKKVVFLVTGNVHKFYEARLVLNEFDLSTAMLNVDTVEVQDDNVENVAKASAIDAVKKCNLPIIVEDAGLFIDALNGFPGPYSSYVFRTVGIEGVLRLMGNARNRNATFTAVVAYHSPERNSPKCFHGSTEGKIAAQIRGAKGFGFDPIFMPNTGNGKTFAEMPIHEKNRCSHRAKALRNFARWYVSKFLGTC